MFSDLKMAFVAKKTYSRTNELCSLSDRGKENVDPFDELLSSPLKRDVQFKPLSFWGRKGKDLARKKKLKNVKYKLYESSNSDDNSPNSRKKKPRLKYSNHEDKSSPLKNRSHKINALSTTKSFTKKNKSKETMLAVEKKTTALSHEKLGNQKSQCFENAYVSKNTDSVINSLSKSCDGFEFVSVRKHQRKQSGKSEPGPGFSVITYSPRADEIKSNAKVFEAEDKKSSTLNNAIFKRYEDISAKKDTLNISDEKLIYNESKELEDEVINFSNCMENTLVPFQEECDNLKFLHLKTQFSNFNENNKSFSLTSISLNGNSENFYNILEENSCFENLTFKVSKENISEGNLSYTDNLPTCNDDEDLISTFYFNDSKDSYGILNHTKCIVDDDTSSAYADKEDFMGSTFCEYEMMGKKFSCTNTVLNKEINETSTIEFQTEDTILDNSDFVYNNTSNIDDLIQKLLLEQDENSVTGAAESSLTSDDNSSSLTDEESVLSTTLQPDENDAVITGTNEEKKLPHHDTSLRRVSHLTAEISHLTISGIAESGENFKSETERLPFQESDANEDAKDSSVCIDLRNVTTKRKYRLNGKYQRGIRHTEESVNPPEETERENIPERERELEETFEQLAMNDKTNFEWNKTVVFSNPIFESTRVQDISINDTIKTLNQSEKPESLMEESRAWLDHSYALKPGKKWMRTMSILKQIRNGNETGDLFDSSRIKGRKFESFVKDVLEMQNGKSGWSISVADLKNLDNHSTSSVHKKKSFSHCISECRSNLEAETSLKDVTFNSSIFSVGGFDGTVLETSLINPTIKIIHPKEKPSTFGLKVSGAGVQDECSIRDGSSSISGRDFVLLQCGQDDVLPFEEYFNERTLKDCKKIGEGVYGEVFMSADAVIKIIPIEGSDKVNGEPQKTFEEILSEVVIALKLSNLRNGEKNRTDGFSEVKRCWCVKGRYPKYLLRLWDEYDRLGSGSENDSPIMFKEDQLFIILELGNGGKDLESFVFSSASQSLSIFIQTTLSLAAAEKAFEFEHRDLHWGNVLISETKDKFVTVVLDNMEYKIPSKGVKVCIIDFTLSRIYHEGFCIFNDLSIDPSLFVSEGDYQFEIYRMMLREVSNDWSLYRPKTNIFWLHYTLDKMINMVRYKNKKTKLHKKCERELKILESEILDYKNSADFVSSNSLSDVMKRL